jgi:osmotically-inducible protein OsmY
MSTQWDEAGLQRMLAEDDHFAELGVDVVRGDGTAVLTGRVESPQRREEIARRVAECLPGVQLRNDIVVVPVARPAEAEDLT